MRLDSATFSGFLFHHIDREANHQGDEEQRTESDRDDTSEEEREHGIASGIDSNVSGMKLLPPTRSIIGPRGKTSIPLRHECGLFRPVEGAGAQAHDDAHRQTRRA